jgi:hypothetical protein
LLSGQDRDRASVTERERVKRTRDSKKERERERKKKKGNVRDRESVRAKGSEKNRERNTPGALSLHSPREACARSVHGQVADREPAFPGPVQRSPHEGRS